MTCLWKKYTSILIEGLLILIYLLEQNWPKFAVSYVLAFHFSRNAVIRALFMSIIPHILACSLDSTAYEGFPASLEVLGENATKTEINLLFDSSNFLFVLLFLETEQSPFTSKSEFFLIKPTSHFSWGNIWICERGSWTISSLSRKRLRWCRRIIEYCPCERCQRFCSERQTGICSQYPQNCKLSLVCLN